MKKSQNILTSLLVVLLTIRGNNGITYYEYYAPEGQEITSGLVAEGDVFTLNEKEIAIYSGSFHYFRVHPDYWRDTFKKIRAAGLNTIQTYMPWNLHNPIRTELDFGNGTRDMSPFLDVRKFVQMAQEEDLLVMLRPGPYICSEFEFGGMPSWLLGDYTMAVRTAYKNFTDAAENYLKAVGEQLGDLAFINGGPIIAVQIENEYGYFGYDDHPRDKVYLKFLEDTLIANGFSDAVLFTADNPTIVKDWGSLPGEVLMGANFETNVDEILDTLKEIQPNRPLIVAEFWAGWSDFWTADVHSTKDPDEVNGNLNEVLEKGASVNLYMFIGGTSFGFLSGARDDEYLPNTSSYDYDAPLTEAGGYHSVKYQLFKETFDLHNPLKGIVDHPDAPPDKTITAYGSFSVQEALDFQSLLDQVDERFTVKNGPIAMEEFPINSGNGQSYGYALYTTTVDLPEGESTLLIRGHVRDMAQVMVDGQVVTSKYTDPISPEDFGFWGGLDKTLSFFSVGGTVDISILVENLGRVNGGVPHNYKQKKGLWEGPIRINEEKINEWEIVPLEFQSNFINSLTNWETFSGSLHTPSAYRVVVTIDGTPNDTYLDMSNWSKGFVAVNGFNIGRYWSLGPVYTLYVPAPLLHIGDNEFVIFEQYEAYEEITLIDYPLYNYGIPVTASP